MAQQMTLQEIIDFLNAIKPAYTQFILIGQNKHEDKFPAFTDDTTIVRPNKITPDDAVCAYDDGGFWDSVFLNVFTATALQTVFNLNPSYPYTAGTGDLQVLVDGVLQTIVTDYAETDALTVTFVTGLTGGEEVLIFEDDSTNVPLDHNCMRDEVTLTLV